MLLVLYFLIFCFITIQEVSSNRFGQQKNDTFLRQRRLNEDPCSASGSNRNNDCASIKENHNIFTKRYRYTISQLSSTAMDCSISSPGNPSTETKLNTLEYWYAVETSEKKTETWLRVLEERIFEIAFDQMSFCIISGETQVRRSLQGGGGSEYGILSVTSMPYDENRMDVPCPGVLSREDMLCYVIQGKMRILTRASDDLSLTTAAMLDAIKNSMSPNTVLLGDDIRTVTNVTYLGTTQLEAENWVILPVLGPTIPNGNNNQINIDIRPENGDDDDGDGGRFLYIILTAIAFLILALLLLLWLQRRSRRNYLASHSSDSSESEIDKSNNLTGTGNLKNNKNTDFLRNDTETQSGSVTTDYDSNIVEVNSKDLGEKLSGIDVHKCTSLTCKICMAGFKNTDMVGFKLAKLIGIDELEKIP
mmetsp:Transcript_809/g.977  ORF Transcript_809/g.977 Transcript_809/m.977 type:complete len:420 (-) Transcript_809:165-1424(-)